MQRLRNAGVRVALATDVGGGTSYSMLQTANEAYKVLQISGQSWPAVQAFYQMTLGNARALGLEDRIGAIDAGMEADLVVLDSRATPAMAHRMESRERGSGRGVVRSDDDGRRPRGPPDLCRGRPIKT